MNDVRFDGQWVGRDAGDTNGWVTLELERQGDLIEGIAYHYPDDPDIVSIAVEFAMPVGHTHGSFKALPTQPFRPHDGLRFRHDEMPNYFPNALASRTIDLDLTFDGPNVHFAFTGQPTEGFPGSKGHGTALRSHVSPSRINPTPISWADFRASAFTQERGRFIHRGQAEPWRLRTSFHRSPRKNLNRYRQELVPDAHRIIGSQCAYRFDLNRPADTGAFYNLLQHHGYPTPLLDWTWSPFIAAYFAFERVPRERTEGNVRIYMFDRKSWLALSQRDTVAFTSLQFSIVDVESISNNRVVTQQACVTLANIDDIEDYLEHAESLTKIPYLRAVDIPVTDREQALSDLALMGIHHGALFPGLDGTCRSLAFKHFGF
ncbi:MULTISPECIES: FRG domain-containing protein [unclassified Brevundimonas]|uniref:FRG domain-containing protein n=1 Tax=unclassified Brevundimonas TaxID=2622653 RepID=UPI0025C67D3B|nr:MULTISPECIES: FRG domain-containing protein [unclassified Brevundimonas]